MQHGVRRLFSFTRPARIAVPCRQVPSSRRRADAFWPAELYPPIRLRTLPRIGEVQQFEDRASLAIVPCSVPTNDLFLFCVAVFLCVPHGFCIWSYATLAALRAELLLFRLSEGWSRRFFLEATAQSMVAPTVTGVQFLLLFRRHHRRWTTAPGESSRNCRARRKERGTTAPYSTTPLRGLFSLFRACVCRTLAAASLRGRRLNEYSVNSTDSSVASRTSHHPAS